ncbi:MAG TPA: hypothetical protein VIK86_02060 [Candidatus Paceibacterota bacterium]
MKYVDDALMITELVLDLERISESDDKQITDYTQTEILKEAKWVLSNFNDGGNILSDNLYDDNKEIREDAENQVKQLEKYIKKYSINKVSENKKLFKDIKVGDKILLNNGKIAEFIKLNRTRFLGTIEGKEFNIPIIMVVKMI